MRDKMPSTPLANKIDQRWLGILVALCIFSSVAGGIAYVLSVYALVRQDIHLHAMTTGQLVRDGLAAAINERIRVVGFLAEEPLLGRYFQTLHESTLYQAEGYLDHYSEGDAGAVGYLLDAGGTVVAASNRYAPDSSIGNNYAGRPYFQRAINGTPVVSMAVDTTSGKRGIYVGHPVTGSGAILGVVVVKYPLSIIEDRWAQLPGIMAMVSPEGQVFAVNREDWEGKSLPARALAPNATAAAGEGEEWLVAMPDGRRYVGMTFAMPVIWGLEGWRLVYLHDAGDIARAVVHGFLTPTGFALMGLMAVVLLGAGFLYHRARRALYQQAAAEKETAQAGAVLEQIFNITGDGIRVIDADFTVVEANQTFAELVGRPLAEIKGRKCHEVFPGRYCGTPECPKSYIVDHGGTRLTQEVVKKNATGREIACLVEVVPFHDAGGKVVGVLESIRDISDRVASEQALEQAFAEAHKLAEEVAASHDLVQHQKVELEKAYHELQASQAQLLQREKMASIGQLAAGVAHEINNPMGFISSNLGTMAKYMERVAEFLAFQEKVVAGCCAEGAATKEIAEQRKKLKIDYILKDVGSLVRESLDGAERVRKIVQGLKNFSRLDQAEVQAVNLNECLESTINIVWNELKYKAEVKREYGELPKTVCNPQQLNQVFMNLLVNAAQAIEKHGVITIKTWADADWVYVTVRDSGSGIPKEKLPRIFEPFYTTKEVGKGTGLGLSIAYDIVVKNHKGAIEVQSEEGVGALFTVKIPLVAEGNLSQ